MLGIVLTFERLLFWSVVVNPAQQRAKEERESQRARMDARHSFILDTVAGRLKLDRGELDEFLLSEDQVS